jgi:hypothetical protein
VNVPKNVTVEVISSRIAFRLVSLLNTFSRLLFLTLSVKKFLANNNMKIPDFCDITPYSAWTENGRFGRRCILNLQGRRISQARNKRASR